MPKFDHIFSEIGHNGNLTPRIAEDTAAKWFMVFKIQPEAKHEFMIGGFDQDPRQLWEIPEVCDYVRRFAGAACLLTKKPITQWNLEDASLCWVALACKVGKILSRDPNGGATVEVNDEEGFIQRVA